MKIILPEMSLSFVFIPTLCVHLCYYNFFSINNSDSAENLVIELTVLTHIKGANNFQCQV